MKTYIVGGYVRDRLLGRETKDHDFVVVGSTPEEMLAAGFTQVGSHFPVFLNRAGDEYALARKERKVAPGYSGFDVAFDPTVTLEDDLLRRDLTINAMAREVLDWNELGHAKLSDEIIDPFGGIADLKAGVLRHVSDAFAEDPVRILRVARFAARYNFTVASDTKVLMKKLVEQGEVDHLVAERVWQEMGNALMEKYPGRFFWELHECGAMAVMFPNLRAAMIHMGGALERAAMLDSELSVRFSVLCSLMTPEELDGFSFRYRVPNDLKDAARATITLLRFIGKKGERTTQELFDALCELDAWKQPHLMVGAAKAILLMNNNVEIRKVDQLLRAHRVAFPVKFNHLTAEQQATLKGRQISEAIDQLRVKHMQCT